MKMNKNKLHEAVLNGDVENLAFLLKNINKKALNSKDEKQNTALHLAVQKGNLEMVDMLLAKNANPDVPNDEGKYPIHFASKQGSTKIVASLLNSGAFMDAPDNEGKSALDIAVDTNNTPLQNLLKMQIFKKLSGEVIKDQKNAPLPKFLQLHALSKLPGELTGISEELIELVKEGKGTPAINNLLLGPKRININATDKTGKNAMDYANAMSETHEQRGNIIDCLRFHGAKSSEELKNELQSEQEMKQQKMKKFSEEFKSDMNLKGIKGKHTERLDQSTKFESFKNK